MALIPQKKVDEAKNADLLTYLQNKGYNLIPDTRSQNSKAFRLAEHDSLVISNNKWFWFSQNFGGSTLDFLVTYEGKEFRKAVEELTGNRFKSLTEFKPVFEKPAAELHQNNEENKTLLLPEKNVNYRRAFAYLTKTRCIDPDTISGLMHKKLIYESKDGHNCVFIGTDKDGTPKYANLRGTLTEKPFKKECSGSDKKFSFSIPGSNENLRVFESAIDAISDITLSKYLRLNEDPFKDHRLSLGGVETLALHQYLSDHPKIKNVILRLDNDSVGKAAAEKIKAQFISEGLNIDIRLPASKDVNEDLIFLSSQRKRGGIYESCSVQNKINQAQKFIEVSQKLKAKLNNQNERTDDRNVKCNR